MSANGTPTATRYRVGKLPALPGTHCSVCGVADGEPHKATMMSEPYRDADGHLVADELHTPRPLPGDIGLVYDHKPSIVHELIHARERQIYGATEWANLTHAFCVLDEDGAIIEAEAEGFLEAHISKYKNADFWVVHVPATAGERALAVARWRSMRGRKYDFLGYVSEAFLCFGWPVSLRSTARVYFCSAAACYGGLTHVVDYPEPYDEMTPADIGMFYRVPISGAPAPLSLVGRLLDRVATVGKLIGRLL